MTDTTQWMQTLQTELTRELGQPVTVAAGGTGASGAGVLANTLVLPQARLLVQASVGELAGLLIEGRVLDAGQADPEIANELWTGMLSSIAERLGGRIAAGEPMGIPAQACIVGLGSAAMNLSFAVAETAGQAPSLIAPESGAGGNYDLLMEVELDAMVRFGSREMELGEVLELGPGDVVELDRHVTDPVDLIVGDKIVARGEVVLMNGNFGLRVTEVAEPMRRLESIRCLW